MGERGALEIKYLNIIFFIKLPHSEPIVPSEVSVLQMFSFNPLHHSESLDSLPGDNNSKVGEGRQVGQAGGG